VDASFFWHPNFSKKVDAILFWQPFGIHLDVFQATLCDFEKIKSKTTKSSLSIVYSWLRG
jgi:hypothetical protein